MSMNNERLYTPLPFKAKRAASWNREGYNRDGKIFPASQASVLADIPGPGMIVHIWFALSNAYNADEPLFLRKNSLEFYWDDNEFPACGCRSVTSLESGMGRFGVIPQRCSRCR